MDIGAAQVQRPGYVVEGRHQHTVGVFLAQGLADAGNLAGRRFAGIFYRVYFHRVLGYSRTVAPDQLQRVQIGAQRHAALLPEVGHQLLHAVGRRAPAIDADLGASVRTASHNLTVEPLGDGRRALNLQFHQLELRALQLLLGSEKVARVSPEGGTVHRDDGGAGGAIET